MKLVELAVNQLIKGIVKNRCYPLLAIKNAARPFIVYQRTDSERYRSINNPSGVARAYIQIDVYGDTYESAKQISAQVEQILDAYKGIVEYGNNSPKDSIEILSVVLQNDLDILDQTDEPVLFRVVSNFIITYKQ